MRVHTDFGHAAAVPADMHWTKAKTHDLHHLVETHPSALVGWTVVLDIGVFSHSLAQHLRYDGIDVVCPRQRQARLAVNHLASVELGRMTPTVGIILRDVTGRVDLDAKHLAIFYHQCWQIELFFRAIEHRPQPSRRGAITDVVWATILLGIIHAHLGPIQPPSISNVAQLRAIAEHLTVLPRFSG